MYSIYSTLWDSQFMRKKVHGDSLMSATLWSHPATYVKVKPFGSSNLPKRQKWFFFGQSVDSDLNLERIFYNSKNSFLIPPNELDDSYAFGEHQCYHTLLYHSLFVALSGMPSHRALHAVFWIIFISLSPQICEVGRGGMVEVEKGAKNKQLSKNFSILSKGELMPLIIYLLEARY